MLETMGTTRVIAAPAMVLVDLDILLDLEASPIVWEFKFLWAK